MAKKKIVKPTPAEKVVIMIRLKRKYPQMFKPGWTKKSKKSKSFDTVRTKTISSQLRNAGMSQKTIDRLRGKKK